MIAQINQFQNLGIKRTHRLWFLIRKHASLWPDRQHCFRARTINIDSKGFHHIASIQFDTGCIAAHTIYDSGKLIIFTNKLRNEGIFWLFIKGDRIVKLLDDSIIKHRNPIRHRQGFGLVMRHINNCDAQIFVNMLDFILHMFA